MLSANEAGQQSPSRQCSSAFPSVNIAMRGRTSTVSVWLLLLLYTLAGGHPLDRAEDSAYISSNFLDGEADFNPHPMSKADTPLETVNNAEIEADRARRDVYNNEVLSHLHNISGTFNHSYEVRCSPRMKFVVDGLVLDVKRDMLFVLRFICLMARTYNSSYPVHPVPGFNFGYIASGQSFNATDYASNSSSKQRFEVLYEEEMNSTSSETYATFTHSCHYGSTGSHFMLGERTIKPLSVVWMLLNRLACRDWWEGRAPSSSEEVQEEHPVLEERVKREVHNDIDETPHELNSTAKASIETEHTCEVRCGPDRDVLHIEGVKVRVTQHLDAVLHLLCSVIPRDPKREYSCMSTTYGQDDLGVVLTAIIANSKPTYSFDVVYADGVTRHAKNVYTFYSNCDPEPVFSVAGHTLAPQSLLWTLFRAAMCKKSSASPPRVDGRDAPDVSAQQKLDVDRARKNIPSQFHNFDVRCNNTSTSLIVDNVEVKVTNHMKAAVMFLCNVLKLSKYLPDEEDKDMYRFGYMETEEWFHAADYALNSTNNQMLDVTYQDGITDNRTDVTAFRETCRADPLGPEFSLDAGILQPRSIMWNLFSKMRCDNIEVVEQLENQAYLDAASFTSEHPNDDYINRSSEEIGVSPDGYSDNHTYEVRCSLGSEKLVVDGLPVEVTEHLDSALRILCFSSGLHRQENASVRLGYLQSIEYFNPEEYTANSTSQKRLDVLYTDDISRGNLRVISMMPDCRSNPPQFELNSKKVKLKSLVWTLYKKLECDTRSQNVGYDPSLPATWDPSPHNRVVYAHSPAESNETRTNVHFYTLSCRRDSEAFLVDGSIVKITRDMYRALRFLCDIMDMYVTTEDGTYRFGYIVTKESFTTLDYAINSTSNKRFDVRYALPGPRSEKRLLSLKSTCRNDPPGDELSLNGSRLEQHSILWSLFSKVRCPRSDSAVSRKEPCPLCKYR